MKVRREKTVKIGEKVYVIQSLTHREIREAKNNMTEIVRKVNPITGQIETKEITKTGDFQTKIILFGLKSWNYKDEKGNPIPITEENIDEYLEFGHDDRLFDEIIALSSLSDTEKKT
ncbi:hypothetical protein J7K25_00920 [bacterium]|nr:hypothetical protein [bacterium]